MSDEGVEAMACEHLSKAGGRHAPNRIMSLVTSRGFTPTATPVSIWEKCKSSKSFRNNRRGYRTCYKLQAQFLSLAPVRVLSNRELEEWFFKQLSDTTYRNTY